MNNLNKINLNQLQLIINRMQEEGRTEVSLEELKQQLTIFDVKETLTYGEITKKVKSQIQSFHQKSSLQYPQELRFERLRAIPLFRLPQTSRERNTDVPAP